MTADLHASVTPPPADDALKIGDATALSEAIHARRVSCVDVMRAHLARTDAMNPAVNALVSRRPHADVLAAAATRDAQLDAGNSMGWMHGFPVAVKDLAATVDAVTTMGSPIYAGHRPDADSWSVARMKAAGAIVVGKTNTPEFGLGSHTYNTIFGVTRNAYDLARTAGGSSGAAAVSLALRLQPVADGSDMMGSLRNPAAWNNVFGLRPSTGRVPSGPIGDQYVSQLSTDGPMGRSVRDVAQLLQVLAGPLRRAPLSIEGGTVDFVAAAMPGRLDGLRVGWLGDLGSHLAMEAGVLDACASGLRRLESLGAVVEPTALGFAPERVWDSWCTWRSWLVAGKLGPLYADPVKRAQLKPEGIWEIERGLALSAADIWAASIERTAYFQQMVTLFEQFDLLVLPSAQMWPFPAEWTWPREVAGRTMDSYHRWMEVVIYASLAGLPAMSVPVGFGDAGLPMGMQLIGPPHGDAAVLRAAAAYEQTVADVLARAPHAAG